MSERQVNRGERVRVTSSEFNGWQQAARFARAQQQSREGGQLPDRPDSNTIKIRNDSGEQVPRHGILAISDVMITPEANQQQFEAEPLLVGVKPQSPRDWEKFVVCLEPLAAEGAGAIGRAASGGVVVVRIEVANVYHEYADVDDSLEKLKSHASGSARILWRQAGTGEKWAMVRLGCVAEEILFELQEELTEGGEAEAEILMFGETQWHGTGDMVQIHDSIGHFRGDIGDRGWALWSRRSLRYEMIQQEC